MKVSSMLPFLSVYPNKEAALLLSEGFSVWFCLTCSSSIPDGEARNLLSALSRPEVVLDKLTKEVGWAAWWALSPINTNSGFESIPVGLHTEERAE